MSNAKWILYPSPQPISYAKDTKVFIKTKSRREKGRIGTVVNQKDGRILVQIPITKPNSDSAVYQASHAPKRLVPILTSDKNGLEVIVTRTTSHYRLLAASQLISTDYVLEIGCSNGEASLVIANYVEKGSLIGIDVSTEMIQQAQEKFRDLGKSNVSFHVVDPFGDPKRALEIVTNHKGPNNSNDRLVVFIDIGGNRDLESVVKMLHWVETKLNPRLCIIKSEAMVDQIQQDTSTPVSEDSTSFKHESTNVNHQSQESTSKRRKLDQVRIEPCGTIVNGKEWYQGLLQKVKNQIALSIHKPRFSHPKKAPLSLSPLDQKTPICRYHNYHKDGCSKGNECDLDHVHCHYCLEPGHKAKDCIKSL
ncbi:hypothetical protein CTEN210_11554 [Chaetoceros tenuissimus]|uniref:C3H1-type domain-containing protein n=1 Tax=Chaetoceros tenuissimus TaxID=426638 RepID=A0AAD3CZW2_9STRA|nr:hypothetical protein CTEN210_11554 [Chaetoceros tenuissimus]